MLFNSALFLNVNIIIINNNKLNTNEMWYLRVCQLSKLEKVLISKSFKMK